MGGHGGLNILPQKRWNVYNYDNREKVRKDEEEAAREEQLKREQSLRRDAELRIEMLRQARGLAAAPRPSETPSDSNHINLFEGLKDFSSLSGTANGGEAVEERKPKKDDVSKRDAKRKREERSVVVSPEDEKYRMGYGVAGKGVKAPWYLSRPSLSELVDGTKQERPSGRERVVEKKKMAGGKKTIEHLREERMKRERQEKNREHALLLSARKKRRGL